jgi:hypothetical protein
MARSIVTDAWNPSWPGLSRPSVVVVCSPPQAGDQLHRSFHEVHPATHAAMVLRSRLMKTNEWSVHHGWPGQARP